MCEKYESFFQQFLVSIVVSIPACHAGDPGSIPGQGAFFNFIFKYLLLSVVWPTASFLPYQWLQSNQSTPQWTVFENFKFRERNRAEEKSTYKFNLYILHYYIPLILQMRPFTKMQPIIVVINFLSIVGV